MNLKNIFAVITMVMMSIFSFSAFAHDDTGSGIRIEFSGNTALAYPGPSPIWKAKIPADLDRTCLSDGVMNQTGTFICDSTKQTRNKLSLRMSHLPVVQETTHTEYQITIDSKGSTITEQTRKERPEWASDLLSILFFYVPAVALLIASVSSIKDSYKNREKILMLYGIIIVGMMTISSMSLISPAFFVALIIVLLAIAGGIAAETPGFIACLSTTIFIGFFAPTEAKSFVDVEYLMLTLFACTICFLIRETIVFVTQRKRFKQERITE